MKRRPGPETYGLTVKRGRWGRREVSGLPWHLQGAPRRKPDALDLIIMGLADAQTAPQPPASEYASWASI